MSVFDNIFDSYSASELREIFREDTNSWPEEFCRPAEQSDSGSWIHILIECSPSANSLKP